MKIKTIVHSIFAAALFLCFSASFSAAQEDAASTGEKMLVMPVLNSAFEDKDKFYGLNEDLSRNLQSFFSFTLDALSDYDAVKPDRNQLYESYPVADIYSGSGDSLKDKLNLESLLKAGNEYGAQIVLAAEAVSTYVLVDGLKYTLKAEVKFVAIDVGSGEIIYDKTLSYEDIFSFSSRKEKESAGDILASSIGGKPLSHAELAESPMKFGGMVTGFPFLGIARQLSADFRK